MANENDEEAGGRLVFEVAPDTLHGTPIYPGVAYGICQVFSPEDLEVPQFSIDKAAVRGEIQRLRNAIAAVDKQLGEVSVTADDDEMPAEALAFVDVHRTILNDPALVDETIALIKDKLVNAEWALSLRLERTRREFESIEDDYLRERVDDIAQVVQRVQRTLAGRRSAASLLAAERLEDQLVLIVDELDPTDILQLRARDDLDIVAIVMESGSPTSHAAILSRSLEIPTLVGVANARQWLHNDRGVLIDADGGVVDLDPSPEARKDARARMKKTREHKRLLRHLKDVDSKTATGTAVELCANIALPDDLSDVRRCGAEGIGLFRTEFLFLNRDDLPGEEEQVQAYGSVIRAMRHKKVVIRTADLGGDKMLSREAMALLTDDAPDELNPVLGLRALRFCFRFPQLLKTQLRAIMRAAATGSADVRILLPMVTSPTEVAEVRRMVVQCALELESEGHKYRDDLPMGGMIEVPVAVAILPELGAELDFFSLGTNDLIQYALAVDRTNAAVAAHYDEYHPGIMRLIGGAVQQILEAGKPLSVCGEMASRPELLPFFVGLGCRSLSMDASALPFLKERLLSLEDETCQRVARSVLRRRSSESIRTFLRSAGLTNKEVNDADAL